MSVHASLEERLRALPPPPERLTAAATAYFVRHRALDALIAGMVEDPALRARAEAEPAAVLREAGLPVEPQLVDALRDAQRAGSGVTDRLAASLWL